MQDELQWSSAGQWVPGGQWRIYSLEEKTSPKYATLCVAFCTRHRRQHTAFGHLVSAQGVSVPGFGRNA